MKIRTLVFSIVLAGLVLDLPLTYANDAPVEDLSMESVSQGQPTTEQAQNQAQAQPDDMDSPLAEQQAAEENRWASSSSQALQAAPDESDNDNSPSDQPGLAGHNDSSQDRDAAMGADSGGTGRVAQLEQQLLNITNMNLPQQIEELRQEVQQLTGRIQLQQHDIKMLEAQQRRFYQDLDRRIKASAGAGSSAASNLKQEKSFKSQVPLRSSKAKAGFEAEDAKAYRAAFDLLVKKQYPKALSAFQGYTRHYPHGDFVANAYYWIGELYLKENKANQAMKIFKQVVSEYPNSNKVPDAKLKLAIIEASQGRVAQAREQLKTIKHEYPDSTAAQLATIQLQRMN